MKNSLALLPFGRAALLAVAVSLAVFTSACVAHVRPAPVRGATVVKVRSGHMHSRHIHSDRCGHFRDGRTWYLARGHVHKRGCGHALRRGVWVVRR